MSDLPTPFIERMRTIIPKEYHDSVLKTFEERSPLSVRVNALKTTKERVTYLLRQQDIAYREVPWYHDALILDGITARELGDSALIKNGFIFIQSLSSMLVPLILDPKPGDHILDMCAAPGGKTTQMAALMHNQGTILAIDSVRDRFFKLKSVVELLGATCVQPKLTDGRTFSRGVTFFDRVLVDAPCTSEGRFKNFEEKTFAYWRPEKIKEMSRKQRELLMSAGRLLKPGGILVYSTCTFAPEENETTVDWFLQKINNTFRVIKPDNYPILSYRTLEQWNNKVFDKQMAHCLRILPTSIMEGFFVAKFMKVI